MQTFTVRTHRRVELLDVTSLIRKAVSESAVQEGLCVVFVPHTTAGITINENADPDVVADILAHFERMVPPEGKYRHSEGNSDAHIKATLTGFSQTLLIEGGRVVLGTWQGLYFCEFDGPRERRLHCLIQPSS